MSPRGPRRNRVTPWGDIVAVPARGTLLGNRGLLHDAEGRVVRDWQVRRWITCRLFYRDVRRTIMAPNRYTELFFLDEVTSLAAGHRPCSYCRYADLTRYRAALADVEPAAGLDADTLDRRLHAERLDRGRGGEGLGAGKRRYAALFEDLCDGCFVERDAAAWLVWGGSLARWSPGGYTQTVRRPRRGAATLLTPPTNVAVLRAGYRPGVHRTLAG